MFLERGGNSRPRYTHVATTSARQEVVFPSVDTPCVFHKEDDTPSLSPPAPPLSLTTMRWLKLRFISNSVATMHRVMRLQRVLAREHCGKLISAEIAILAEHVHLNAAHILSIPPDR